MGATTSIPTVKVEPLSQDERAMAIDPATDENDPHLSLTLAATALP